MRYGFSPAGDANIQRAWGKQEQLARILSDVLQGQYRPRSPSPPARASPFFELPTYRPTHGAGAYSPPPPTTRPISKKQPIAPSKIHYDDDECNEHNKEQFNKRTNQDVQKPAGPSAFAQYLNSLLFPGLPQVLRQPLIFQDALVGAVLMLVAAVGWINLIQSHFGASSAIITADHLVDEINYLQFWPALVHVASLIHMIAMR